MPLQTSNDLLADLLGGNPEDALGWLTAVISGEKIPPKDFNWDLFAEKARDFSLAYGDPEKYDLKWAEVTVRVYEYPAWLKPGYERAAFPAVSMETRVAMIKRFGARPGDPVLDVDTVIRWVMDRLPPSEAWLDSKISEFQRKLNAWWRRFPLDDWKELRLITRVLSLLSELIEAGFIQHTPQLTTWVEKLNMLKFATR